MTPVAVSVQLPVRTRTQTAASLTDNVTRAVSVLKIRIFRTELALLHRTVSASLMGSSRRLVEQFDDDELKEIVSILSTN